LTQLLADYLPINQLAAILVGQAANDALHVAAWHESKGTAALLVACCQRLCPVSLSHKKMQPRVLCCLCLPYEEDK
jgi:hypothetical protein